MADEANTDFRTVVTNLAKFTRGNSDCNARAIGENVMRFLRDVASADHTVTPGEKAALADAEDVLLKDLKLAGQKASRKPAEAPPMRVAAPDRRAITRTRANAVAKRIPGQDTDD